MLIPLLPFHFPSHSSDSTPTQPVNFYYLVSKRAYFLAFISRHDAYNFELWLCFSSVTYPWMRLPPGQVFSGSRAVSCLLLAAFLAAGGILLFHINLRGSVMCTPDELWVSSRASLCVHLWNQPRGLGLSLQSSVYIGIIVSPLRWFLVPNAGRRGDPISGSG